MLTRTRLVAALIALAVGGLWFVTLAPTALGGSTSYILVSGHSMEPLLHTGDLAIVRRQARYAKGDVIAYRANPGHGQVIHRITGGNGANGFVTQGDNRTEADQWNPRDRDVMGRMWVHLPAVPTALAWLRQPNVLGVLAGLFVASGLFRRTDQHDDAADAPTDAGAATIAGAAPAQLEASAR